MMDALEGVLEPEESAELHRYLSDHPDLAAEWEAMQAVDDMLREAPPIAVPVHLMDNTLYRLPTARNRRLFMSAFFFVLLLGGLLPFMLGIFVSTQLGGASLGGQSIFAGIQVLQVIGTGMLSAIRTVLSTQPIVFGWFTLMLGVIATWIAVFRQYSVQVQPVLVPANQS